VCEPLVLWISKSKAVVDQTRANFEPGGKYESLLEGFCGTSLGEASAALICDDTQPALIMATVGSFNQSAKGEGSLRVHQKAEDTGGAPLWETLATRTAPASPMRRPLIIVYDEGHNLADQQADLLLELEPDAILVASATMRTPSRLGQIINRLEQAGWSDRAIRDEPNRPQQGLVTALRSGDVVEAGLVKRQIILGGYPPMMLSFRYLRALNLVELLFRTRANCLNNTAPLGMSESASNLRLRWVTSWRKSRVSSQRKSTVKVVTPIADRLGNRLTLRQQHV
jgi:type III restriction enzyme